MKYEIDKESAARLLRRLEKMTMQHRKLKKTIIDLQADVQAGKAKLQDHEQRITALENP